MFLYFISIKDIMRFQFDHKIYDFILFLNKKFKKYFKKTKKKLDALAFFIYLKY